MASEARGCLLFALPRLLVGRPKRAALTAATPLPKIDVRAVHREDLPAVVTVRRAAEGCRKALERADSRVSAEVRLEVMEQVGALFGSHLEIATRLMEARAYSHQHGVDEVARQKAELEMQLVGASVAEIKELKAAMVAVDQRASHTGAIDEAAARLRARLVAAGTELEAVQERLGSHLGSEELEHELRAYQRSADLALEAFTSTWSERVTGS